MHYVISTTWGPTDTTRAALPFIFAASALQAADTVMIMLFHDAVTIAIDGVHQKIIPFGPPSKFSDVFSDPNARILVCKPCAEARSFSEDMLIKNAKFGGMNDLHQEVSRPDAKFISF
ncbi:MAG TPA: DsrE family protein [Nitrosomonas sp.]|nr:DsrE family protein [Nitrosomonas sp.]